MPDKNQKHFLSGAEFMSDHTRSDRTINPPPVRGDLCPRPGGPGPDGK